MPSATVICPPNPDRPLRVIGIDPECGFAGGESQVLGLTLELIRLGHDAELLCDPQRSALAARSSRQRDVPSVTDPQRD